MSLPFKIPDYFSPLVGWRVWNVKNGRELRSIGSQSTFWRPGEVLHATCTSNHTTRDHIAAPPPNRFCSCGSHSYSSMEYLLRWEQSSVHPGMCIGQILMWGRVIEHSFGYRAEYAQLKAAIYWGNETAAHRIEEAYGVEIASVLDFDHFVNSTLGSPFGLSWRELVRDNPDQF
jgi:hypothetical protein